MNRNDNRSAMRAFRLGWGLIVCLLLGSAGCGSKATISGKVLYQGKPLPGGTVTLFPAGGKGAFSSPIQEDGSYRLSKVPSGEAKISVETESLNPGYGGASKESQTMQKKYVEEMQKKMKEEMPEGEDLQRLPSRGKYVRIPLQYKDPDKSGLTYTVTSGEQTHDIELK